MIENEIKFLKDQMAFLEEKLAGLESEDGKKSG